MTPIQEFLEQEKYEYYPDICKLWLEKEKEFAKQCFEAGRAYQSGEIKYSLTTINHNDPNFEDFYKSLEK